MISTGGTVEAATRVLLDCRAAPDITVAATHGLLVAAAQERLRRLPIRRLLVADTVAPHPDQVRPVRLPTVAPLLADAIGRLHHDEPLDALLMHT